MGGDEGLELARAALDLEEKLWLPTACGAGDGGALAIETVGLENDPYVGFAVIQGFGPVSSGVKGAAAAGKVTSLPGLRLLREPEWCVKKRPFSSSDKLVVTLQPAVCCQTQPGSDSPQLGRP